MTTIIIELSPVEDWWNMATERQVEYIQSLFRWNGLFFPFKTIEEAGDYISKENADTMISLLKKGKLFETKIIKK